MEGKILSFHAARDLKLTEQRLPVNPDPHGGYFHSPVQGLMPEQDVAVQLPVIIVRSPAVMRFSGSQRPADLHDAGSMVFLYIGIFPAVTVQIRIKILQFLCRYKRNFPGQFRSDLGIMDPDTV